MELMQDARTDRQSLNNVDNKTSLRAYLTSLAEFSRVVSISEPKKTFPRAPP